MKNMLLACLALCLISACSAPDNDQRPVSKFGPGDPFEKTIVESQQFNFNADEDFVAEGEQGILVVVPKGSLLDADGNAARGAIQLELAEATRVGDMLFSNLTTTASGNMLSTGGMFYVNATQNGEQLFINPEIPASVHIPRNTEQEMMLYDGVRDSNGNMDWKNPKKTIRYLTPVPLNTLNFTPKAFENAFMEILPFQGKSVFDQAFVDSVYYSIRIVQSKLAAFTPDDGEQFLLEPNGKKYGIEDIRSARTISDTIGPEASLSDCGIDPVRVKAIKEKPFEGTFIATKEFERRLQAIHNTYNLDVLDVYVNNLDKDLWVVDSMAAQLVKGTKHYNIFMGFCADRLTNVADAKNSSSAKALADYYTKRSNKIAVELASAQEDYVAAMQKKQEEYDKALAKYVKVLYKREQERMEYFNYALTDLGWKNVDTAVRIGKTFREKILTSKIENTEQFDMINVYVWMSESRSLMRLIDVGGNTYKSISMRGDTTPVTDNSKLTFYAIANIGDDYYFASTTMNSGTDKEVNTIFNLVKTDKSKIDEALNKQDAASNKVNSIERDLAFQQKRYTFNKEAEKYIETRTKVDLLFSTIVDPCCRLEAPSVVEGSNLFWDNCVRCHSAIAGKKMTGPAFDAFLEFAPGQYTYFNQFVKNSQALIASGNERANKVYLEYGSVMPAYPQLNEAEIMSIYNYILGELQCKGEPGGYSEN